MTLYITKNGEKLGPYTLAEAQNLVAIGTVQPTDWAWYEGIANWIPLNQVPGFAGAGAAAVPAPHPERPVLVWVICLLFFICIPFGVISMVTTPLLINHNSAVPEAQKQLLDSEQGLFNYYIPTALNMILVLTWSIQFFRLKSNSIYFFLASLGIGAVMMVIKFFDPNWLAMINGTPVVSIITWISLAFSWCLNLALLYYNWHLIRKGVLR